MIYIKDKVYSYMNQLILWVPFSRSSTASYKGFENSWNWELENRRLHLSPSNSFLKEALLEDSLLPNGLITTAILILCKENALHSTEKG